jgi:hypothetical protein
MSETRARSDQTKPRRPELLADVQSAFPFTLFPDSINIDRRKITVIHRAFLGKSVVVSVPLADIHRVELSTGPLLGSLKIMAKFFDKPGIEKASFEKHIEKFKPSLISAAFNNEG